MSAALSCDPASRPRMSWVARLAWLKREGVSESDERVAECRAALAYYRIHKVIDDESGLSPAGVDRLVSELRGRWAVRRELSASRAVPALRFQKGLSGEGDPRE